MPLAIDPLIRPQGISKIFHTEEVETHALARIDLDVRAGEYVAITGPSADEPTGNLDSGNGATVMGLLADQHAAGATICMVMYDLKYLVAGQRAVHLFDGLPITGPPPHREVA